jgi:hypothetical protein
MPPAKEMESMEEKPLLEFEIRESIYGNLVLDSSHPSTRLL